MSTQSILQDRNQRTSIHIPAYLRDKFGLKKGSIVDVTDKEGMIVITPILENDKE